MSMAGMVPRDLVVVTAGDTNFMGFMRGMVSSLRALPGMEEVPLRVMDLGLTGEDRAWLAERGAEFATPRGHFGVTAGSVPAHHLGYISRPYFRDYFPGYGRYLYVDGDAWLQRRDCVDAYLEGAAAKGLSIAHERSPDYRFQAWLMAWMAKHTYLGFGVLDAAWLMVATPVNAGIFCMTDTAPHWDAWAANYEGAYRRSGTVAPHDQYALNLLTAGRLLGRGRLPAAILPPRYNWICDRGPPMWNDAEGAFCEPRAPYTVLGALHLAGPAKKESYEVRRTGGGTFQAMLTWGARPPGG
ncbi:hypothetical protein VQH23_24615 [Pararoseomonas sp. SCSIO 73927]|uniref:hypothetical protein n=1 Tax=Pararoseomonas sp. SCSIO 73927 TaxID=3114537 RepID=UPI0030D03B8E